MAIAALASMGGSLLSSVGGSAAASGMASSAMSFLGGSSAGLSNSGLLSMGGSLLSGLANMFSGDAEAKAQKKAQEERWRQQLINTREQYRQLGQQEQHANKEFHSQLIQNQVSLLQQKAQVELMAGATGTGGGSVSAMLADLTNQAGQNQSKIIDNFENQQQSFINQAKAIQMGGQMEMREFKKPSAFSRVAKLAMNAGSAYMSGAKTGKELSKAWFDSRTYSSGLGKNV